MIPMILSTSAGPMLLASSSQQVNLFGRSVSSGSLWKMGAAAAAGAAGVGFLSGLGWSLGMGIGAATMSPNTQRENAIAYQQGVHEVDRQWAWEEAQISRDIDAYYQDYDRTKYLEQQLYNQQVKTTVEKSRDTQADSSSPYAFNI